MKSTRRLELELAVFGANYRLGIKDAIFRAKRELKRDLSAEEVQAIETLHTRVYDIACKLAPHFGMIWYRSTKINLNYAEYDADAECHDYRTAVTVDGDSIYIFNLDKYYPREMVNRFLEVTGHSARVEWCNEKPTISKGYKLVPHGEGWEVLNS